MSANDPISSFIKLNTTPFPDGVEIVRNIELSSYKYGILHIHANKYSISKKQMFFLFSIDCSGSMSEYCKDGRTKMQHIHNTLANMLRFFSENEEAIIFVKIFAFDDKIYEIISTTQITRENVDGMVIRIQKMYPKMTTNIELALKYASKSIKQHLALYPQHSANHIFMTDGHATAGKNEPEYLASLVTDLASNYFIAFGLSHSVNTMTQLGNANKNSSNWLIDKLENAGFVYGEILNNELFISLYKVEIVMKNGMIYDYKTGMFVKTLYIGNIVTEVKKDYHILALDDTTEAFISGTMTDETPFCECVINLPQLIDCKGNILPNDLTEHLFRLSTQQYMFQAKDLKAEPRRTPFSRINFDGYQRKNDLTDFDLTDFDLTDFDLTDFDKFKQQFDADDVPFTGFNEATTENKITPINEEKSVKEETVIEPTQTENFKKKLNNFLELMRKYMRDNNKNEDSFMKGLCDDMYLTIASLGTIKQKMCITARESSQGRQQSYNVSDFNLVPVKNLNYELSRSQTTSYRTDSVLSVMKALSS
jgi:hypothetical protein